MRISFLLIVCSLLALPAFAQPSLADTSRVLALLQHGRDCLFKPGEAKSDLDSALQLAQQASALSRQFGYRHGLDDAAMLAANIHVEAKRWPLAWVIYPTLTDTSRINLLALMVSYRITGSDTGREKFDSAQLYMTRLLPLCDTLRNVHCVSNAYRTVANAYREAGDKKRSLQLWARGFPRVRSFGDIIEESRYGWGMIDWYYNDSSTNPIFVPLFEQMAVDEGRLLPKIANEEQFSAISELARIGNGYYIWKQTELGTHIDSLAIRVNQGLHQHNAMPWFILSYIYSAQGKTKEGLTAALDALRIAETDNGPVDGAGLEAAAKIYFVTGDFDKSLEYFNKALPLFEKNPKLIIDPSGLFYLLSRPI
jgi:tetratricopeptide (TPR) repeat protein